jgi:uncharacterized phage infection (PIP) family protein YhgE
VRFLNDIAASCSDFSVSEQDYAGTLRQVMFDSLNQLASRLPPEVSLRLMTIAMEFSDMPNKDEIANAIRKMTGERDENKPMTPEEQAQAEEQAAMQSEAMQLQRATAKATLDEQLAKIEEIQARAAKLQAEADSARVQGGQGAEMDSALANVRQQAADEIDRLSAQLQQLQAKLANETIKINREADTAVEVARINADSAARVAEIQTASDKRLEELMTRIDELDARGKHGEMRASKPRGS